MRQVRKVGRICETLAPARLNVRTDPAYGTADCDIFSGHVASLYSTEDNFAVCNSGQNIGKLLCSSLILLWILGAEAVFKFLHLILTTFGSQTPIEILESSLRSEVLEVKLSAKFTICAFKFMSNVLPPAVCCLTFSSYHLRTLTVQIWDSIPKPEAHRNTPLIEFFNVWQY